MKQPIIHLLENQIKIINLHNDMKILQPDIAFIFIGGFYLSMSLIHFVLFLYNRHRKANLVYSIGIFIAFINYALIPLRTYPTYNNDYEKVNILLSTATNGALLFFISYYLFSSKMQGMKSLVRKLAWVYVTCFLFLIILDYENNLFNLMSYGLKALVFGVVVTICVIGLIKRIPYFPFIVMAAVLLIATEVMLAVDLFDLWDKQYPFVRVLLIIIGYTSPYFAYTAYISIDFANTSKQLVKEHIMNERLTREKYEQEIANRKFLEAQNAELEKNVEERTHEIFKQKEEIEIQSEKIKELDKIKSRFFANISHEFRTPLTLILGPIKKKLLETNEPHEQRELRTIFQNANRLLQLVNQLLDLTKIESGTLTLHARRTDLISFVKIMTDAFQSMAEIKNIQLRIESQAQKIDVYVDREKLDKIINNLLSNSFKFTPPGGQVIIFVKAFEPNEFFKKGFAEIQVKDNGIGIEAAHVDKIFDRFYQADNSATRNFEGTGIGLALTKELVEMHSGTIQVKSELGLGSKFTIQLPLGSGHFNSEVILLEDEFQDNGIAHGLLTTFDLPGGIQNNKHQTILIVEDNEDLRKYIRENLQSHYNVLEAKDGEEGCEIAFTEIPDLIVSDIMMPKMDGIQLCKKLKNDEKTSHIPIVILTAKADSQSKIAGLDIGADDYIPKPFELEELTTRIRNLIENRIRLQEKFTRQMALKPKEIKVESMDDKFIRRITEIIDQHIADSSLGVEKFAREAGMSVAQLYRKINALTGFTPNLIRDMRLQHASNLLRKKAGNIADAAYQSGFNNMSYFSKCFKDKFGRTPSDYIKDETMLDRE